MNHLEFILKQPLETPQFRLWDRLQTRPSVVQHSSPNAATALLGETIDIGINNKLKKVNVDNAICNHDD